MPKKIKLIESDEIAKAAGVSFLNTAFFLVFVCLITIFIVGTCGGF